jgi:hypothetical protein
MVNHLLETSHPVSFSAPCICLSVAAPSSILRTHFQVPYPATPLFATLTKTAGVWAYSSHFETTYTYCVIPECSEGSAFSFSPLVTRHSPLSFPKPPPPAPR